MKRAIIIHYSEIGLKGENAPYFIDKLVKFIKFKLEKKLRKTFQVSHFLGRIVINLKDDFSDEDEVAYSQVLKKIFGIKNYKFVFLGNLDLSKLGNDLLKYLPNTLRSESDTFCVRVKRSQLFHLKSVEVERELGARLLDLGLDKKVKLKGCDLLFDIEIFNDIAYFSFQIHEGAGGFPPNSQSKLISLISSGIDSPVASYLMMRRGARVIFVHFSGYPLTGKEEAEQVEEIVGILADYQLDTKLYIVPFGPIQNEIATNVSIPAKLRVVLYKRLMLKIALNICKKEKAKGLVTGDSFGQVASQTPDNLFAIGQAVNVPIYQPLIAFDKEDIVRYSEKIGTFEISKLPCKDSCSMFSPKNPELKANVLNILKYEDVLPIDSWISDSLNGLLPSVIEH